MPAGAANPDIDTARIARIYAALADSPWADAAEREAVSRDAHPGTRAARDRIRNTRQYHAAAAVKAVTRGIRGIAFGAAGLPAEPEPHRAAAVVAPDARFVFADIDPIVSKVNEAILGGSAAVCTASLRDPAGMLACPEIRELPRPLHLQAQMSLHFWAPELARDLLREYAQLLPARSELLVTWTLTSDTDAGRDLMATASDIAGAVIYRHPAESVAGWLDDAGFEVLPPGPADVRGWVPVWAERERAQSPGRAMGVAARLR